MIIKNKSTPRGKEFWDTIESITSQMGRDNSVPKSVTKYNHKEAFCLMQYRSNDGTEAEQLWNSRDGVTPFIILSRNGKEMHNADWDRDACDPSFEPPKGMRIFVDATVELVTPRLKEYVEVIFKTTPRNKLPAGWKIPQDAFDALLPQWLHNGEAPWIVTV